MSKILITAVLILLFFPLKSQKWQEFGGFSTCTEEELYHELKDSIPLYSYRLDSNIYSDRQIIQIVILYNTLVFYRNLIGRTYTMGYDSQTKDKLNDLARWILNRFPKIMRDGSDEIFVLDTASKEERMYVYCVQLDIHKQKKILEAQRCWDVVFKAKNMEGVNKKEEKKFEKILDKLEEQIKIWQTEHYFLPIEKWVNLVPRKKVQWLLKEYEHYLIKSEEEEREF